MSLFGDVFSALNAAGVRYVVAGGTAVVLHGHARMTLDLDLFIDFEPEEAKKALAALAATGLSPRQPVSLMDFADPETRASWIRDKNMRVFSLIDRTNPMRIVDLFTDSDIPFGELFVRSVKMRLAGEIVHVASIPDLIRMKRSAARPVDFETSRRWKRLRNEKSVNETMKRPPQDDATWEGTRRWQRTRALEATPDQRLRWLEEAIELAFFAGAARGAPASSMQEPSALRFSSLATFRRLAKSRPDS